MFIERAKSSSSFILNLLSILLFTSINISLIWTFLDKTDTWKNYLLSLAKKSNAEEFIVEITSDVLKKSSFSGPFFSIVEREDGSFSYLVVSEGSVKNDHLIDGVEVEFPNGEYGIISENENGTIDIFFTRNGPMEKAILVDSLITGIKLPDGSILPVKFSDGRISNGRLVGEFKFFAITNKKQVIGEISYREKILSLKWLLLGKVHI